MQLESDEEFDWPELPEAYLANDENIHFLYDIELYKFKNINIHNIRKISRNIHLYDGYMFDYNDINYIIHSSFIRYFTNIVYIYIFKFI